MGSDTEKNISRVLDTTAEARFSGLTGVFRQWSSLGIVGVMSGLTCWLVMVTIPGMHKEHLNTIEKVQDDARIEIKEERLASRSEAALSREHGSQAAKELGSAIKSLNDTFIAVQAKTQANQEKMIELQIKKMDQDK